MANVFVWAGVTFNPILQVWIGLRASSKKANLQWGFIHSQQSTCNLPFGVRKERSSEVTKLKNVAWKPKNLYFSKPVEIYYIYFVIWHFSLMILKRFLNVSFLNPSFEGLYIRGLFLLVWTWGCLLRPTQQVFHFGQRKELD